VERRLSTLGDCLSNQIPPFLPFGVWSFPREVGFLTKSQWFFLQRSGIVS